MTVPEMVTLLGAVGSLIGVLGGIVIQLRGQDEARKVVGGLNEKIDTAHDAIAKVVTATDGMKDALVAATAAKSHAEGILEGKEIEKANPTGDPK